MYTDDIIQSIQNNTCGIHANNPKFVKEMREVAEFYKFYGGRPDYLDVNNSEAYGQLWQVNTQLDYKPTRTVRNHTKKLIDKQARFMFGAYPNITMKPITEGDKDKAEMKRTIIDQILDKIDFWAKTSKAFIDATVGKRVLLVVDVLATEQQGNELKFRYFPMHTFEYLINPGDESKLDRVTIVYQDPHTFGLMAQFQLWHTYTYYMEGNTCKVHYRLLDGNRQLAPSKIKTEEVDLEGNPIYVDVEVEKIIDTGLPIIPCKVITNGGRAFELSGESDVKDLMDMATDYNKTTSDYRDALRFKMFEQPVFIDADSDALRNIKIAPNSIIDLKTDPALDNGEGTGKSAQATTLSSTFNFSQPADSYLDRLKKDMYELMDQPLPEQLQNVPSAKALRFMFYDLIARCEQKWLDWSPAIKWLVDIVCTISEGANLYPDLQCKAYLSTPTNLVISHNYPIPEDDEIKREVAIKEVQANVLSHKSYIRKYGEVEDEDGEWNEIMEEMDELNGSMAQTDPMAGLDEPESKDPEKDDKEDPNNKGKENKDDSDTKNKALKGVKKDE